MEWRVSVIYTILLSDAPKMILMSKQIKFKLTKKYRCC